MSTPHEQEASANNTISLLMLVTCDGGSKHYKMIRTCATQTKFLPLWHYEEPLRSDENLNSYFVGGASLTFTLIPRLPKN